MLDGHELIAAVAQNANKVYCESLGDFSQKEYAHCEQWQKDSLIAGVKFKLENPEATPADQHEGWMKMKLDEGWAYGPVKDVDRKLHPCMLPYDQLPAAQQVKDKLFGIIVNTFAAAMITM